MRLDGGWDEMLGILSGSKTFLWRKQEQEYTLEAIIPKKK